MPYKLCVKCKTECGPRSYVCKKCQHPFHTSKFQTSQSKHIKQKLKPKPIINHKEELQVGDKIKIIGGGPYLITDENKYIVGYRGKAVILSFETNGMFVKSKLGREFIWTGPKTTTRHGIVRWPCTIVKLKR